MIGTVGQAAMADFSFTSADGGSTWDETRDWNQ